MTNDDLVDALIRAGVLKTPHIVAAFRQIDRGNFVPREFRDEAYANYALPLGHGATISQPYVVAFMLELLQPLPGEKILDVGSGSGWTTTLLAHIVGERGKVIAIERVTELRDMGEANCARYNFVERGIARFVAGDGTKGFSAEAPFDAIHAAAAAFRDIPAAWKVEVKAGGRIVAPIGPSVWKFVKQGDGTFAAQEYYGFSFVPLVEE